MKLLLLILPLLVALVSCHTTQQVASHLKKDLENRATECGITKGDCQKKLMDRIDFGMSRFKEREDFNSIEQDLKTFVKDLITQKYPQESNLNLNAKLSPLSQNTQAAPGQQSNFNGNVNPQTFLTQRQVTSAPEQTLSAPGSRTLNTGTSTGSSFPDDNFLCKIFESMYTNIRSTM